MSASSTPPLVHATTSAPSSALASKDYRLDCYGGGVVDGAPDLAIFSIEPATAAFIIEAASFARKHDLHTIERFDSRVTWIESADDETPEVMPSEGTILCIDRDSFWFRCTRKHGDNKIETVASSIAELAAFHGLAVPVS